MRSVPTEAVAELLTAAGFRMLPMPIGVANLKFEVQAAFLGTSPSPDIVLVSDTSVEDSKHILRTVEGFARALDVTESRRPISLVLVGPRPDRAIRDAMTRVCRVLEIPHTSDVSLKGDLRDRLAVLLPLQLPSPEEKIAEPLTVLSDSVEEMDPTMRQLVDASVHGSSYVAEMFYDTVSALLKDVEL